MGETDTVTAPAPVATPGSMIETGTTPGGWMLGFWRLGLWKLGFGMSGENCGAEGGGNRGGAGAETGRKEGAEGGMEGGGGVAEIGDGEKDWTEGGGGDTRLGFGLRFSDDEGARCGVSGSDFSGLGSRAAEEEGETAIRDGDERGTWVWFRLFFGEFWLGVRVFTLGLFAYASFRVTFIW